MAFSHSELYCTRQPLLELPHKKAGGPYRLNGITGRPLAWTPLGQEAGDPESISTLARVVEGEPPHLIVSGGGPRYMPSTTFRCLRPDHAKGVLFLAAVMGDQDVSRDANGQAMCEVTPNAEWRRLQGRRTLLRARQEHARVTRIAGTSGTLSGETIAERPNALGRCDSRSTAGE